MKSKARFIPLSDYRRLDPNESSEAARQFYEDIRRRRTVREFSSEPVPRKIIENCILAAGTAPNGANKQPWHFAVISDPDMKAKIRVAAEKEEKEFYEHRATPEWLADLEPLGTDWHKPFLQTAPYLIVIFEEKYELKADGTKHKNYYSKESVGIATGMLITAVHNAGLASLTHTPNPMGFLNRILKRPANEKAFLILVVGYPAEDAEVPDLSKKPLEEIATFI